MSSSQASNPVDAPAGPRTLLGHPAGLYTLFFAEMWERFSFYGMRALLLFYMLKSFLQYGDTSANAVYGAYMSLIYMMPFFGGMLADRLLGPRRAVVFGGLLMAAGEGLLMLHAYLKAPSIVFFAGLGLLICGNGFFKPNISTMVGSLYPQGSARRDGGFTIFYMGVNLGSALSSLLCGYIGQTYGWHFGFGLASIGMLVGVSVFVAPRIITQVLIAAGALSAMVGLFIFRPDSLFSMAANTIVAAALLVAASFAVLALSRGGVPGNAGAPPDRDRLRRPVLGPVTAEWAVYLGSLAAVGIIVLLVSGLSPLTSDNQPVTLIPSETIHAWESHSSAVVRGLAVPLREISRPAGIVLVVCGLLAFGYVIVESFRLDRIARQRMFVVLILTSFSMPFWAFLEQAGSSINAFTDRNVDRVSVTRRITEDDVGQTIRIQPTQAQVGYHNGAQLFTLNVLDKLREKSKGPSLEIDWTVTADDVGMGIASQSEETPASTYQSVNATCILLFGLPFTALWALLARFRLEPSTPVKFALGLLQLGIGFAALWYGAKTADPRGMVWLGWLLLGYLLHTTGELCLSPVGLSMITKLSPRHLVSTVMGTWFLVTAFAQYLGAIIAQFASVSKPDGTIPAPTETVHVYGNVFGGIAVAAVIFSLICFALSPVLTRWMHTEASATE